MPSTRTLCFSSALSRNPVTSEAVAECVHRLGESLKDQHPDLLFLFISPHHSHVFSALPELLYTAIQPKHLFGCTGGSIIGAAQEVERAPALALTAATLPEVKLATFHLQGDALPDLDSGPQVWYQALGLDAAAHPQFVLLADPFSFPADDLLRGLDFAYPTAGKIGGLASGANGPGQNALFQDHQVHRSGAIGLMLCGDLRLDCLVAQGCRPIGKPYTITHCARTSLFELDGRKPLELLSEIYEQAPERDQNLLRTSLFLGIVMDPFKKEPPQAGDFLIRNLIGADPRKRSLSIGALLREGQVVQFHLRDGQSASEDLARILRDYSTGILKEGQGNSLPQPPAGALLFSCLGRGAQMYGRPDHDTGLFRELVGELPVTGFFCNGEIGPVGATTYLHGFTSCFGIFRPSASPARDPSLPPSGPPLGPG